jgi:hypothetical protein
LVASLKDIKDGLLELYRIGQPDRKEVPTTYAKIINKGTSRIETLLKLVLAPHDPPETFVSKYLSVALSKDPVMFQRVLEMKGIKRHDQLPLLAIFNQKQ